MAVARFSILMVFGLVLGLANPGLARSVDAPNDSSAQETTAEVPLTLYTARLQVMQQLIEAGRDPDEAREMASALTEEDLDVLVANPNMMQPAGARKSQASNFWWSFLLLGGLIALLAAGDGSFVQSS